MNHDRKVRDARASDYGAFLRLYPELGVDDRPQAADRFVRELVPTMLVVERAGESDAIDGYAFFQTIKSTAYVRHVVTAPEARRTGLGRALMVAIAARARDAGCTAWCLNVKPGNEAAIALYERMGLTRAHESQAMKLTWAHVSSCVHDAPLSARLIEPGDDARVESATNLVEGQLAMARALGGRVLMALYEGDEVVGATIFDPAFPGAYPFRVARPELALVLLDVVRPHALAGAELVKVVVEGQRDVTDALVAAGAVIHLDILHMKGPLPAG